MTMGLDRVEEDLEAINTQLLDVVRGVEMLALMGMRTALTATREGVGLVAEAAGEGFSRGMEDDRTCGSCGRANPSRASYCMACGTELEVGS